MTPSDPPTSVLVKQISNFKFSSLDREKLLEIHQCLSAGTTKVCPGCLNTSLLELRTMNKKVCTDCGKEIPWNLEPKQKPLA
jgi:uncharacterized protein (DUF983 family)